MSGGGPESLRCEYPLPDVAVVTFVREPVNALDASAYREAADALRSLVHDGRARAAVITGAGHRAFCAGTHLDSFRSKEVADDTAVAALDFFGVLRSLPMPLIAALNGPAIGGGAMIAAQCDVLVSVPDSYLAVPELTSGFLGAASHIKRLVPYHKAQRMMLMGERLTAEEASRWGVILELVDPAELRERACEIASQLTNLDPIAVRDSLQVVREPESTVAFDGYKRELAALSNLVVRHLDQPITS